MLTLVMLGIFTLLWASPVAAEAAAPTITEFHVSNVGVPQGITAGPDGNLWFTYQDFTTNANAIGRITTSGAITLTPTPSANSGPTDITPGPDGNMWFTEAIGNIGKFTTS
jgi:virginiamycin B lyase